MADIAVDIDEVLYPWMDNAHRLSVQAGITNGRPSTSWHPWVEYGCRKQEWLDVLRQGTITGDLYNQKPIPGSLQALDDLIDLGYDIHLVTARGFLANGDRIKQLTVAWLHDHGVPYSSLTFTRSKGIIQADWAIDDSARNLDALELSGARGVLMAAAHNSPDDWPVRVEYLPEFVDLVATSKLFGGWK